MERTFVLIVAFAVVCSILIAFVGRQNYEFGLLMAIAGCLIIVFMIIELLSPVLEFVATLSETIAFDNFDIVLKVIAIAFIADIAEGICQDTGQTANAKKIAIAAKLTIIIVAIPLFNSILIFVQGLVGQ